MELVSNKDFFIIHTYEYMQVWKYVMFFQIHLFLA